MNLFVLNCLFVSSLFLILYINIYIYIYINIYIIFGVVGFLNDYDAVWGLLIALCLVPKRMEN